MKKSVCKGAYVKTDGYAGIDRGSVPGSDTMRQVTVFAGEFGRGTMVHVPERNLEVVKIPREVSEKLVDLEMWEEIEETLIELEMEEGVNLDGAFRTVEKKIDDALFRKRDLLTETLEGYL